jgi:hypothetical protein
MSILCATKEALGACLRGFNCKKEGWRVVISLAYIPGAQVCFVLGRIYWIASFDNSAANS